MDCLCKKHGKQFYSHLTIVHSSGAMVRKTLGVRYNSQQQSPAPLDCWQNPCLRAAAHFHHVQLRDKTDDSYVFPYSTPYLDTQNSINSLEKTKHKVRRTGLQPQPLTLPSCVISQVTACLWAPAFSMDAVTGSAKLPWESGPGLTPQDFTLFSPLRELGGTKVQNSFGVKFLHHS